MSRVVIPYPTAAFMRTPRWRAPRTPADRLQRCYVVETSGCWRWIKGITTTGYGHFSISGVYYQAHRLLYILRFGHDIPDGLFPDHTCRNRWCVNPDHLEPVTHQENVRRGSGTRLTADLVATIRAEAAAGLSQRKVGALHGIDHSTVSRIVSGKRWADVSERLEPAA